MVPARPSSLHDDSPEAARQSASPPPAWAAALAGAAFRMVETDVGGPKFLRLAWVINAQKGGTLPFVLMLMWWFDCWTATAWAYLALHGSYGLCWLLKELVFLRCSIVNECHT